MFQVPKFDRPDEGTEVQDVVEGQIGRRSFRRRPGRRAGETVPKAGGERGGEDDEHDDFPELCGPSAYGPAEAEDERQDAEVEENVELEKQRKRFSAQLPGEKGMLFRREGAAFPPLIQPS